MADLDLALLSDVSGLVKRGPGRPDVPAGTGGVITGTEPVGTLYVSTDGANVGAWQWQKTVSGWVVTVGDTGWRDISGTVVEGASVSALRVRRAGVSVFLLGRDLVGRSGGYLGALREGFGGIATTLHVPAEGVATKRIVFPGSNPREMWVYGTVPHVNHVFATSEPWPNTLPGTPA